MREVLVLLSIIATSFQHCCAVSANGKESAGPDALVRRVSKEVTQKLKDIDSPDVASHREAIDVKPSRSLKQIAKMISKRRVVDKDDMKVAVASWDGHMDVEQTLQSGPDSGVDNKVAVSIDDEGQMDLKDFAVRVKSVKLGAQTPISNMHLALPSKEANSERVPPQRKPVTEESSLEAEDASTRIGHMVRAASTGKNKARILPAMTDAIGTLGMDIEQAAHADTDLVEVKNLSQKTMNAASKPRVASLALDAVATLHSQFLNATGWLPAIASVIDRPVVKMQLMLAGTITLVVAILMCFRAWVSRKQDSLSNFSKSQCQAVFSLRENPLSRTRRMSQAASKAFAICMEGGGAEHWECALSALNSEMSMPDNYPPCVEFRKAYSQDRVQHALQALFDELSEDGKSLSRAALERLCLRFHGSIEFAGREILFPPESVQDHWWLLGNLRLISDGSLPRCAFPAFVALLQGWRVGRALCRVVGNEGQPKPGKHPSQMLSFWIMNDSASVAFRLDTEPCGEFQQVGESTFLRSSIENKSTVETVE